MQILKQHKVNVLITALLISTIALSMAPFTVLAAISTPQPTPSPTLQPSEIAEYENQTLTPINQYLKYLKQHPNAAIKGTQFIDPENYTLPITGLVNKPTSLNYSEVVDGFDSVLQVATLPCVEGWSVTMLWEGVAITNLLEYAGGVSSDANTVIFYASDGYSSSLPLEYIEENNIMIAYKMNNVTLTPELGWPFFLVAKSQYGYKWVEWITEIKVSNDPDYRGYWESRGFPNNATVTDNQGTDRSGAQFTFTVGLFSVVLVAVGAYAGFKVREVVKNKPNVQKCTNKP